jgi:hypothetical protein
MNRPLVRRGIDVLGNQFECNATTVQIVSDIDEMPQAA